MLEQGQCDQEPTEPRQGALGRVGDIDTPEGMLRKRPEIC